MFAKSDVKSDKQLRIWAVPFTEEQSLSYQMFELKRRQDSLRRGLYKKLEDAYKEIAVLREELELIKNNHSPKPLIITL
jgi:hypothetical protein